MRAASSPSRGARAKCPAARVSAPGRPPGVVVGEGDELGAGRLRPRACRPAAPRLRPGSRTSDLRVGPADGVGGAVRRAVVDEDDRRSLGQRGEAVEGGQDVVPAVHRGDDDGDGRRWHDPAATRSGPAPLGLLLPGHALADDPGGVAGDQRAGRHVAGDDGAWSARRAATRLGPHRPVRRARP